MKHYTRRWSGATNTRMPKWMPAHCSEFAIGAFTAFLEVS